MLHSCLMLEAAMNRQSELCHVLPFINECISKKEEKEIFHFWPFINEWYSSHVYSTIYHIDYFQTYSYIEWCGDKNWMIPNASYLYGPVIRVLPLGTLEKKHGLSEKKNKKSSQCDQVLRFHNAFLRFFFQYKYIKNIILWEHDKLLCEFFSWPSLKHWFNIKKNTLVC